MTQIALMVEFEIDPDNRDAFLAVVHEHAQKTLAEEPGCVRFDVLEPFAVQQLDGTVSDPDPSTVYLYEVYLDDAAFATHLESPLLPLLRERYQPYVRDRRIVRCHVASD